MTIWQKLGVGFAALTILATIPSMGFAADAAHPTVVELFQSQGCSSCPPAEANVGAISDRADVLALSFEVDYWDRLGWKDTFSKAAWTARQYAYAHAMGRDGVYTPQVVVNGRVEGDGLEPGGLADLMRRGERSAGGPSVGISGSAVAVGRGPAPAAAPRCGSPALSAHGRSRDPARRKRRPHAAVQGRGAGDGAHRPLAWRGGVVSAAGRGRAGPRRGGDRPGRRIGADSGGGATVTGSGGLNGGHVKNCTTCDGGFWTAEQRAGGGSG